MASRLFLSSPRGLAALLVAAGNGGSAVASVGDPGARAIYLDRCSRCHEPFDPSYAPASQWPMFVARYGPRAGLVGHDRDRVLAWLQANSGR
jgi:hypothetical protein